MTKSEYFAKRDAACRPSKIYYCNDNEGMIYATNEAGLDVMIPYGAPICWLIEDDEDEKAYQLYFG